MEAVLVDHVQAVGGAADGRAIGPAVWGPPRGFSEATSQLAEEYADEWTAYAADFIDYIEEDFTEPQPNEAKLLWLCSKVNLHLTQIAVCRLAMTIDRQENEAAEWYVPSSQKSFALPKHVFKQTEATKLLFASKSSTPWEGQTGVSMAAALATAWSKWTKYDETTENAVYLYTTPKHTRAKILLDLWDSETACMRTLKEVEQLCGAGPRKFYMSLEETSEVLNHEMTTALQNVRQEDKKLLPPQWHLPLKK
jgi:hypothetical protein